MTAPASKSSSNSKTRPLIVDLGKTGGKKIKALKKGEGIYITQVEPAIAQVRAQLAGQLEGKEILPVVVIYEKKQKRKTLLDLIG